MQTHTYPPSSRINSKEKMGQRKEENENGSWGRIAVAGLGRKNECRELKGIKIRDGEQVTTYCTKG